MSELSADELFEAEEMWIRDVQSDEFPAKFQQLTTGTKASSSRYNQLRLFLDDKGIVRCEGRIEHSDLLPARHRVADLIIEENHELSNHTGITHTTSYRIRETYWVLQQSVKRVLRKCAAYKRLERKPYTPPTILAYKRRSIH